MSKAQETVLEIDLAALAHNYRYLRSKIRPDTKFMAVVKAFGYGSDAQKIALHLQSLGADYFAVAYAYEGIALRKAGITKPILVLHPQEVHFDAIITHALEPSIYSLKILKSFVAKAHQYREIDYPIHLKFNTGLNRLGFSMGDISSIHAIIQEQKGTKVIGVLTHLAASEDLEETSFTNSQLSQFKNIVQKISACFEHNMIKHVLNTSGILNYPQAQYDMVRSGIGLYGYGNHAAIDMQLQPVATLKTIIAQIHTIAAGETVGYNRQYTSMQETKTATLPLGHADGIGRQYGKGNTYVLVQGKKAPIIGNVCMDMIMIDVSHISCKEGDEVIVFGKELSATAFAASANTISYELLTGLSQRIKRKCI